ncbi:WRKY domain [Dillenia turbinata]|uniref:WRKY domain n=1 Tax=Dillenia turbinata TaxID=194707 RepID=A0AAN8WDM8_9MAGN
MESGWSWEHNTLVKELTKGMELAKQLKLHLNPTSSIETKELLLHKILSSYEKALLILNWGGSVSQPQHIGATTNFAESPISVNGSPRTEDMSISLKDHLDNKDMSKKRKLLPRWTDQVQASSETGLEGPKDDGYSWRKYGQKDILAAKYPRSYYRCTYRNIQGCLATKQVQRSDDDPSIFEVTYRGRHTCIQVNHANSQASTQEKPNPKQNNIQNTNYANQQPTDNLMQLKAGLRVSTENLNVNEMAPFTFPSMQSSENQVFLPTTPDNSFSGNFQQEFVSPATSDSHYYSVSPYQINSFGGFYTLQNSESDVAEIVSATTSGTNSPILDLDFTLDHVELDPNFPFDTPGFFA